MSMFKIVSVERIDAQTVKVRVRMDGKEWLKIRKQGHLGQLYGIDISNAAYQGHGVKAYNPTVSDTDRAQGGIKWIDLYYTDTVWQDKPPCEVIYVDFINKRRINAA